MCGIGHGQYFQFAILTIDPKLQYIRTLLSNLPKDETAIFQDEVTIRLTSKIRSCWMKRGEQIVVEMPKKNIMRHLGGSLARRNGRLFLSEHGKQRNIELFIEHLRSVLSYTALLPNSRHL